jgi:hypothetical protein
MSSGGDKVEKSVHTVIAESGVTLDTGLLGENIVVLALEVARDLAETGLVVDLVTEARGIDNGQRDTGSLLVKLCRTTHVRTRTAWRGERARRDRWTYRR